MCSVQEMYVMLFKDIYITVYFVGNITYTVYHIAFSSAMEWVIHYVSSFCQVTLISCCYFLLNCYIKICVTCTSCTLIFDTKDKISDVM